MERQMKEYVDTIIVGGGQAGLAASYYLTQQGSSHVVLEQLSQPANAWRNQRWDSFAFVTPKWMTRLPGAEYRGTDLDGFMSRSEIVTFFEQYVERFKLPVCFGIHVTAIEQESSSEAILSRLVKAYSSRQMSSSPQVYSRSLKFQPLALSFPQKSRSCTPANTGTRIHCQAVEC
jgi:cation diffusion facilitator CzcD-associated flavoprotein CzcO